MIELRPVKSSNIAAVGYDSASNQMYVGFHGGAVHVYSGVSAQQHHDLVNAKSVGSHFHLHVKGKHPQRKLESK